MSVPTGTMVPGTAGRVTARRISGLRRAAFAAFVMLVVQFALGIYVNLYVTVPSTDHGHGFGQAIANGPAGLTLHIMLGLLLILAALGFLVQAILARQRQGRRVDGDGAAGRRGVAVLRRQPFPAAPAEGRGS